jgi:hypothetical protein
MQTAVANALQQIGAVQFDESLLNLPPCLPMDVLQDGVEWGPARRP